ncbi:MAG: hypothetical protein IAX22_02600 [Candidatus Bathyarchaeota archaeon]|nr:hypothetical protein [Candidatus Bathyarchaeota archaeon]
MQTIQKTITFQKCERCGYTWLKRIAGTPIKCPRCQHPIKNKRLGKPRPAKVTANLTPANPEGKAND